MCLMYDKKDTENLLKRLEQEGGEITCWRIEIVERNTTTGHNLCSRYMCISTVRGWNHSDRCHTHLTSNEVNSGKVNYGRHVYLSKEDADLVITHPCYCDYSNRAIVVKVRCRAEHFVAAGVWSDLPKKQAVFTKFYIDRKEYHRAIQEKGN